MPLDLSESWLKRTEQLLGASFPESYRQAILVHNGGKRAADGELWELMPIRDARYEQRASWSSEDVLAWTEEFRLWKTWPKGGVCIARNAAGDALLFLKEHERICPEVYVWRHETGTLKKIASDFDGIRSA